MRVALIVYMSVYSFVLGGMLLIYIFVLPADEKSGDHRWTTPIDVLLAVLAFVGMLFLLTGNDSSTLKMLWKVVAPVMVAVQLYLNVRARADHMRTTDDVADVYVHAGDLGVFLFVSPALALNLVYAFAAD